MTELTWTERAFDLIADITKQVIALSTGVIALGITFNKDFLGDASTTAARSCLILSWVLLLVAVLFGILTLMATAGAQAQASDCPPEPYAGPIRFFALLQLGTFFLGLVGTVVAGLLAL